MELNEIKEIYNEIMINSIDNYNSKFNTSLDFESYNYENKDFNDYLFNELTKSEHIYDIWNLIRYAIRHHGLVLNLSKCPGCGIKFSWDRRSSSGHLRSCRKLNDLVKHKTVYHGHRSRFIYRLQNCDLKSKLEFIFAMYLSHKNYDWYYEDRCVQVDNHLRWNDFRIGNHVFEIKEYKDQYNPMTKKKFEELGYKYHVIDKYIIEKLMTKLNDLGYKLDYYLDQLYNKTDFVFDWNEMFPDTVPKNDLLIYKIKKCIVNERKFRRGVVDNMIKIIEMFPEFLVNKRLEIRLFELAKLLGVPKMRKQLFNSYVDHFHQIGLDLIQYKPN